MDQLERPCIIAGCKGKVRGRTGNLFCSPGCRYTYHNLLKAEETRITGQITNALKKNRRILARLLGERQTTTVPEKRLIELGYNFLYHTHLHHAKKSDKAYTFCFDLGYHILEDGYYLIVRSY